MQTSDFSPVNRGKVNSVFRVAGRILMEIIFNQNSEFISKITRFHLTDFFSSLTRRFYKMKTDKIFYHHCHNTQGFDYRIIKKGFFEMRENMESKQPFNIEIPVEVQTRRREYLEGRFGDMSYCKKNRVKWQIEGRSGPKKFPEGQVPKVDMVTDMLEAKSAEKLIAVMLDSLNSMWVTQEAVFQFAREVILRLFPKRFFGGKNWIVIEKYIRKFVILKRFETFCLQDVIDDMNLFEIGFYKRKFNKFYSRSIRFEKVRILEPLLRFIFEEFLLNLLKINFYITEKHSTHNKLFFYPKDVWFLISSIGTYEMSLQNLKPFSEIKKTVPLQTSDGSKIKSSAKEDKKKMLKCRPIGKLRFVPKRNSLRPLMTFFKQFENKKKGSTFVKMSKYLYSVKIVLRSVKKKLSGNSWIQGIFSTYLFIIFGVRYASFIGNICPVFVEVE